MVRSGWSSQKGPSSARSPACMHRPPLPCSSSRSHAAPGCRRLSSLPAHVPSPTDFNRPNLWTVPPVLKLTITALKGRRYKPLPYPLPEAPPVLCSTSRCNSWKEWSHLAISSSLPLPLQSTSVRLLAQHSIKTKPANGPPVSPPALPRAAPGAPHSLQRKSQSLHCKSGPALYLLCFQRILLPLSPLLTPLKPPPGSG